MTMRLKRCRLFAVVVYRFNTEIFYRSVLNLKFVNKYCVFQFVNSLFSVHNSCFIEIACMVHILSLQIYLVVHWRGMQVP